ncbi:MAG: dephospho-CoA kinase [Gemmatimonadota bacterium]
MLKVALTGNIASGKSTVASVWRANGARVVDADELSRRAVLPGSEPLARIRDEWGPGILLPSGELDRAALRDVVFRDPEERGKLEEIVHPEVARLRLEAFQRAAREGLDMIVADIPLLFEVGMETEFDRVVLVEASAAVRRVRLIESRRLTPEQAQRMIEAQWPSDRKRAGADYVIENAGSIAELEQRAEKVWKELERDALAIRQEAL